MLIVCLCGPKYYKFFLVKTKYFIKYSKKMAINKLNKSFYNTVLCQAFSPCGNYLFVGDIYGSLSMFHLSRIINPETNLTREELTPKHNVVVKPDYQINSLLTTQNHLLVGGVGEIYAFSWKNLKNPSKAVQPSWTIEIPNKEDDFDKADVNSLIYDEETRKIFAGCGDNKIYLFELESRKSVKVINKHNDYIHSLWKNGNDLLSAGEDGLVNITDLRTFKVVHKIEPHKNDNIARPELGKWIGAVGCNEDYVICGGGPRLSLYHYRFLTNSTIFPIDDKGIHVAELYKDRVFAGGRSKLFYQISFNGDVIAEIPTSAVTTYSAVHQEEPFKVLSIAGSSPKIDISNNFMYRDQQLSLT